MNTTEKRKPFIAPLVDGAADFIKASGAITISELAEYLAGAGVDVRGDDELTAEQLAYHRCDRDVTELPVIANGTTDFVLITLALLVNRLAGDANLSTQQIACLQLALANRAAVGL
jgi:hypothetical protein